MIKVASYCRVSTDKEDQANSFSSQQRFFREYIDRNPEWELYDVYADEGITGTSTKKRIHFNRMINDAYANHFQLILTKEVSRFSRNILDTIRYTRELKKLGIGVIFLSDGFSTLDPDAELRLSIIGSIAQEESRKTSTRVKWGQSRQMERGVVFGKSLLGYDVEKGKLFINPEGAEIVKQIFFKYGVEKKGTTVIARELREAGYKTYTGNPAWSDSQILKILKNEKYVGDLVQKKTITPDYLTHAKKYNHGEEDLIVLKDHHEPIIPRNLWNLVQEEIRTRHRVKNVSAAHSNRYIFSGKIICAECGARFISRKKMRKDRSSYRCWGCYSASRYGKRKEDGRGNILGCDIGMQIRDDLAMDMVKFVIQSLSLNRDRMIHNLTDIVLNALRDGQSSINCMERLQLQLHQLQEKKTKAIDLLLDGEITKEEFHNLKLHCDAEITVIQERLRNSRGNVAQNRNMIHQMIESIMNCSDISEAFLKAFLEYMIIHKDGTVELKANHLSNIWKFQLIKV